MNQNERIRFYELITASVDGTISPEDFARLKEILRRDPRARELYADYMTILTHIRTSPELQEPIEAESGEDSGLDMELWAALAASEKTAETINLPKKEEPVLGLERKEGRREQPVISRLSLYALLMSSAALIFLVVYAFLFTGVSRPTVARLSKTAGAKWGDGSGPLSWGSELKTGPLHLAEGYAELLFEGGTTLVVEGPSLLVLESGSQIFLQEGKVVAKMEGGKEGFVVRSPSASVVDYGTEFGVQVHPTGHTETYVYEGQVEIRDSSNPVRFRQRLLLSAGQGAEADAGSRIAVKQIDPTRFVQTEEMDVRFQAQKEGGYYRWKAYSYSLRRDPSLAAYFPCERLTPDSDVLENAVSERFGVGYGRLGDGFAAAPEWTSGRWPQKGAMRFERQRGQRVRVPSHPALCLTGPITLAVWVNLQENTEALGGHILSCRDNNRVNFQLSYFNGWTSAGQEEYTIQFLRYQTFTKLSSKPLLLEPGRWTLLAVTHDGKTVSFYVNGTLHSTIPYVYQAEPAAADLLIGDVDVPGVDYSFKRFHGILDEAAIFNRVLSPEEIRQMYEAGKP
ncbi:MAG TPA: FecR domain-containing protein [Anaerohalosphaeraceae bacterium]|nr:FecR domain-containing protein [Anaerohalosphaeraceae bacterium]HPP57391.1 FecR domain-containing protein [Anaerohalosphaeraceae bacterium]